MKRGLAILVIVILSAVGLYLISAHMAVNQALFDAIRAKDMAAAQKSLAQGASLTSRDSAGQTALHSAAYKSSSAMVSMLLTHGADVAAQDSRGSTPLHWAVINGRKDNAIALLAAHADPNAQDDAGMTPAHWAVTALKINERTKAYNINLLLDAGADITIRDVRGKTVLDYAREKKLHSIKNLLLARTGE